MKSVLRMSEQELARAEAPGFTLVPAAGVSIATTAVAMLGMMLRFSPGEKGPLPGMDSFDGQLTIATGLGFTMFASAWLIRSVMMKRLQWAVFISLLIHLAVCLTLRTVVVDVPLVMAAEVGTDDVPLQQFTMPDYGGVESLNAEQQEWERPTDVDVQENEQQELERQNADPEMNAEPEEIDVQREVQQAELPERQQREQQMQQAEELEIERQQQMAEADAPQEAQTPQVTTREVRQPDLQAQEMQRNNADLQNERRQTEAVESQVDPTVKAVAAARSELRPNDILRLQVEQQQRELAAAQSESNMAESVELAAAAAARQSTTEAQQMDAARQAQADLAAARRSSDGPNSSAEMQVESVAPSRSQGSSQLASSSAPSAGGAASLQRATGGSSSAAAGTSAESVSVAAASGAATAQVSAAARASQVARGSASVPTTSAGGGGAPAVRTSRNGIAALQSTTIGRSSGSTSGPTLGNSVSGGQAGRSSAASGMTGVAGGTNAQEVNVASAAGAAGSNGQVLASGPSSTTSRVGRGGGNLPAGSRSTGAGTPTSTGVGRAPTVAMTGSGRRTNGTANAGLGRSIGGTVSGSISGQGRSISGAALPSGALVAEQSGALVMAGPQAPAPSRSSSGGLSGPRSTSVGRRSSGLAGLGGGPATIARKRSSLPGGLASSAMPSRSVTSGPKIGTRTDIAGFIRRTVPGISAIPSERISAGFSMRTPEARAEAVRQLGGNDVSEAAVERGLEWLAAHQYAAGNWSIHEMNCRDHDCGDHGQYIADPAATGLALLAFLGAGNTHETGEYKQVVQRGLNWLVQHQKSDGDLFAADTEFAWFYSHGIASIALCEAYGMTKDRKLQGPAQKAIDFIAESQQPEFGGWRYLPRFESDTSVSGWQLMALKSGQMAGLTVSEPTYAGVSKWLDSVENKEAPGRFTYHPTKEVTDAMTAEGLLMRQYLGADREDRNLRAGASFLRQRLPRMDNRDAYYWYYATQVMFHMQGDHWETWNANLRDMLVESQDKDGPTRGSWGPITPTKDKWGGSGGRHYVTCLHLLMLEVYYRHLPLYIDLK